MFAWHLSCQDAFRLYCSYADILDVISVCLHFSDEAFLSIQFLHLIHIALISRLIDGWIERHETHVSYPMDNSCIMEQHR